MALVNPPGSKEPIAAPIAPTTTLSGAAPLHPAWIPLSDSVREPASRPLGPSRPSHHSRREMLDGRRTDLLHDAQQLGPQQLQHALDASLAEGAEAPDIGPSDADRGRAHAQRLADIGAAAETGVHQDRDAAVDGFDNLGERINGGTAGVFAAGAVVRDDDGVIAVVGRQLRVFPGKQSLYD